MELDDLQRRRVLLVGAGAKLHAAEIDYQAGEVRGHLQELPLTYRLTERRQSLRVTELMALVPHVPLQLELRPQTPHEERLRDDGFAIDLILGDPAFDEAFIVEGAPGDVVRALLDEPMRRLLLDERQATLSLNGPTGALRLERPGWLEEAGAVGRFLHLAVELATRVEAAFMVADTLAAQEAGPEVYRGGPGPEARRAAQAARERDLAALTDVKKRRSAWRRLRRLLERIAGR